MKHPVLRGLRGLGLLLALTTGLLPLRAQQLASARQAPAARPSAPAERKLKDVLNDWGRSRGVNILFEESTVEGLMVTPDRVSPNPLRSSGNLERQLEAVLKPFRLTFRKLKNNSYLVTPLEKPEDAQPTPVPGQSGLAAPTNPVTAPPETHGVLPALPKPAEVTITGRVTDETGAGLPAVNVSVKNTTRGTTTDAEGRFRLAVPDEGAVLVFSSVGYARQEVVVGSQTSLSVTLKTDLQNLDEVVVVGYGTQKRSDLTGSVASIPQQRLEQIPNNNFAQALQGAVPGVSVTTNSAGAEQNDVSILIRGRKSITASNAPLVVWDGVPYSGSISDINPTDIQSIEVLKDASATAIYGSRGSNGVILITSRKGREGKATISYDGSYGIQQIAQLPEWLNGDEFYQFKKTRRAASVTPSEEAIFQSKSWVNWRDLATRAGQRQQHTLSVAGGTEATKYYVSLALLNVRGIAVNDDFARYSTRVNLETVIAKWLKFGTNTQLSLNDRSGEGPAWNNVYLTNPLSKAYQADGSLTVYPWPEFLANLNPLAPTLYASEDRTYKVFTNNYVDVTLPFVPGLSYRLNTGVEFTQGERAVYQGRNTKDGLENGGVADVDNSRRTNVIVENILNYARQFNRHNLTLTGLYSYQQDRLSTRGLNARGFPNDVLTWHQAQVGRLVQPRSGFSQEDLISQMLRVNYNYASRYLLTLTGRRDGYSGFGSASKFGFFPSVALGWNVANEPFMKKLTALTELKLRLSYGQNGNQAVGPYQTLSRLREEPYLSGSATAPGYVPARLGNPSLGWETTTSLNVGLDWGLFNSRVQGTLDLYNANTDGLLLARQISSVHGITTITQNIGKTNNRGVELGLVTHNVRGKNLAWTTNANLSAVRNRILDLYGNGRDDILNRWFIGQPVRVSYGFVFDGVWQKNDDYTRKPQQDAEPGFLKIRDVNGDGTITDLDRTVQGQTDPLLIWGFNNTVTYRNFTLYFLFQGMHGHERFNPLRSDDVGDDIARNTIRQNWWTPDNPTNEHFANHPRSNSRLVEIVEPLGFVRFKDVSLAYNLPAAFAQRLGLRHAKVYASGRNLATFTQWRGLDPELDNQLNVPLQREYALGLTFGF